MLPEAEAAFSESLEKGTASACQATISSYFMGMLALRVAMVVLSGGNILLHENRT